MKRNNAIIIGILILIAAVGLLFYAFNPGLQVFTVPVWKWILAAALLYWLIKKVVFGREIANKLSIFILLALGFMLFEREIGTAIGRGPDFVNNWLIILAAVMLDIAVWAIFRTKHKKFFKSTTTRTSTVTNDCSGNAGGSSQMNFKLGNHVYYVDASTQTDVNLVNQLGELNIYYQNTDMGDSNDDLNLNLVNQMGETVVHIPHNWHADVSQDSAMGDISVRSEDEVTVRTLHIRIKNNMGDVKIVSD